MNLIDFFAVLMIVIKALLFFVAIMFLISGIDDIIVDIHYFIRSLYRKFFIEKKYPPLTEGQLLGVPEQPIAVMIPAWNESDIVYQMVDHTISTLNYSNYHIFIGTYPNDMPTQREVERLRERYDNVHRVVCRDPGPTNKADCLNWIYLYILSFGKDNNIDFPIFIMEDAEDVIHPLTLKLFNYLIPRKDMVQLPVVPFEPAHWYNFTNSHYMDEFAENHYKNMVIREALNRGLPSAGVGCGFSKKALEVSARNNEQNLVFGLGSLTEDYEMGMQLQSHGIDKQIFVKFPILRKTTKKSFLTGKNKSVTVKELVAIREFFPKTFWAAVRQKSRWITGISLQGWASLGWKGDFLSKYMLFKDRKALLTSQVNMLGYFLFFFVLAYWTTLWLFPDTYQYPPIVEHGSLLWKIIMVDTFFMFVRLIQRLYCILMVYNWKRAVLSIPNFLWSNVINFFATNRAIYLFIRYLITGKLIAWDHTKHIAPSQEDLEVFRRRLGDMLIEKKAIKFEQLEEAIAEQKKTGLLLGDILIKRGIIQEDELIETIGMQMRVSTREIDPYQTPLELLRILPRNLAIKHSIYPVEIKNKKLVVAANKVPSRQEASEIESAIQQPIEICLTTKGSLSFSIQRGYERMNEQDDSTKSQIGVLLLAKKIITEDQLSEAVKIQKRSYARLGDVLVDESILELNQINKALGEYTLCSSGIRLGDFLVERGYITQDQLTHAIKTQKTRFRRLGDILVEMTIITEDTLAQVLNEKSGTL